MNPYTANVVDQIRLANQQNIQQNLSPGITAGAVGGGQFGSQRGANALALGISNANIGALGQQTAALQAGYSEALKAAQQQRLNQLNAGQTAGTLQNQANVNQVTAGQTAGNLAAQQGQLLRDVGTGQAALANQTQTQGLADVNALATLGGQQQAIAQNRQLAPLEILGKQASIMSGANLPTTVTSTMKGSPLSAIAGLGATAAGIFSPTAGTTVRQPDGSYITTPGASLMDQLTAWYKKQADTTPNIPAANPYSTDPSQRGSSEPITGPSEPIIVTPDPTAGAGTDPTFDDPYYYT